MNEFHLKIITPQGIYLNTKIEKLYLKTTDNGFISILANHVDYITNIEQSVGFIQQNGIKKYFLFYNGILNINNQIVKLIINGIIAK